MLTSLSSLTVGFRLGSAKLAKLGIANPPHMHVVGHPGHIQRQDAAATIGAHGVEEDSNATAAGSVDSMEKGRLTEDEDVSKAVAYHDASEENPIIAQAMGVATLEFGTMLHSIIIGSCLLFFIHHDEN